MNSSISPLLSLLHFYFFGDTFVSPNNKIVIIYGVKCADLSLYDFIAQSMICVKFRTYLQFFFFSFSYKSYNAVATGFCLVSVKQTLSFLNVIPHAIPSHQKSVLYTFHLTTLHSFSMSRHKCHKLRKVFLTPHYKAEIFVLLLHGTYHFSTSYIFRILL